jgi:pilus assembly protein CpaF
VFGKRSGQETDVRAPKAAGVAQEAAPSAAPRPPEPAPVAVGSPPLAPGRQNQPLAAPETKRSDNYYQIKATIFGALIEAIDLAQLAKLDSETARE